MSENSFERTSSKETRLGLHDNIMTWCVYFKQCLNQTSQANISLFLRIIALFGSTRNQWNNNLERKEKIYKQRKNKNASINPNFFLFLCEMFFLETILTIKLRNGQ